MAVNWKNLVEIKCNEDHYQNQLTVLEHRSKPEHYTSSTLHAIGLCVKFDRKLQILPPMICRKIRHLRIYRRRTRGKRAGKSYSQPDKPMGVIRDNLTQILVIKEVRMNRSKYVSLVVSNIQSLHNKDTLLLDHLSEVKADLCLVTETWLQDQDEVWLSCCDIMCNGYKISSVNRQGRHGGGIAFIYKQPTTIKIISKGVKRSFEHAIWDCNISNTAITLVGLYHPPYNDINKCTDAMFWMTLLSFWRKC